MRSLRDPWTLGGLTIPNRVVLAPLAGIGNWFVRLQAKRYGAGLAVSEMVSSFAVHYGNPKTCTELLRIDARERAGGPVSVQLFGHDPEIMRSAAATVARRGRGHHRPQHGLPRAQGLQDRRGRRDARRPRHAVALAIAAREGSGLPVTVKLRAGRKPGETEGVDVARRLVEEAGVAGLSFHPRSAAVHHKGVPDYDLAAELVASLPVPVIVSGGMDDPDHIRWVLEHTGAAAVMLARGSLGNPWLFDAAARRSRAPAHARRGARRARLGDRSRGRAPGPGARRALPAQVPSRGTSRGSPRRRSTQAALQCAEDLDQQREILRKLRYHAAPLATRAA